MDFANLDLRAASERGSWVHLEYDGKPLFAGDDQDKPCRVKVLGMAAPGVMAAFRKIERIEMQRVQLGKATDAQFADIQDKLEKSLAELIRAGVGEWENIIYSGKPLECTPDNVLTICGPGTLFFAQVRGAITDEQRLFTDAVKGS
jgi:hypothetical protein